MILKDKRILITGGTGSLGQKLVSRIINGEQGLPAKIIVFSRDEAKQHEMRLKWKHKLKATDEIIFRDPGDVIEFIVGDIRNLTAVQRVLKGADIVINAAAMKQVPTCEYFPFEAVHTNVYGAYNIVAAIQSNGFKVDTVVGVSTDKACKPVNVMGMTKSIQERIIIEGNLKSPGTRFICTRYGNVLASRGSAIPFFIEQIRKGLDITLTLPEMTRFLMNLDKAVDTIFEAVKNAKSGETYIPKMPSARIADIIDVLIDGRDIKVKTTGIRPGEKLHEVLVSEEECYRTIVRGEYFVVQPVLPELRSTDTAATFLEKEYTSIDNLMNKEEIKDLLRENDLLIND